MATSTNCLGYALATTYWLQGFSSTMAGCVIIDLHDSHGTSRVLGRDGVLATIAVLTSVLSLLHAGFRLSCLLTYPSVSTARNFPLLLVETLAATWTLSVFAVVTALVIESSKLGDKCTASGDGTASNCRPSGYERACVVFATASVLAHLLVLAAFCWTKAARPRDTGADHLPMTTTPTPLSATKYAASLEKPEAMA